MDFYKKIFLIEPFKFSHLNGSTKELLKPTNPLHMGTVRNERYLMNSMTKSSAIVCELKAAETICGNNLYQLSKE